MLIDSGVVMWHRVRDLQFDFHFKIMFNAVDAARSLILNASVRYR